MNGWIGFLKVPILFSFSLSFSLAATVSSPFPILLAPSSPFYIPRCMRSFPPLTPSLSSVLSAVLFVLFVTSALAFLPRLLHHRFALLAPLAHSRARCLFVFLYIFAHISPSFSFCASVRLCVFSSLPRVRRVSRRSLQCFPGGHISMCRALKLCAQLRVLGTHKHIGDVDGAPE